MKRFQIVAAALAVTGVAAATWAASGEDRSWMMPSSELREGMKGHGLTVFRGTRPERFEAEIIGVMHAGIGARTDMILARLDHPMLKDIGVVGGMSGSPVFVNDRMIGAVAYGFTFSKVPIAGITPIEKMLEVYDKTGLEPPPRDIALGPVEDIEFGQPVSLVPKLRTVGTEPLRIRLDDVPASIRSIFEPGRDEVQLEPLSIPLMVSACSQQTAKLAREIFRPLGMEPIFAPVGSGTAARGDAPDIPLENGSAMGIPYLLGDLSMGAVGTATFIRGKKLAAFGHPFSARGPVHFPLGAARILAVVPSIQRSVKLGEIVNVVGGVHQDRQSAIAGVIGKAPDMVPMTVRVVNESGKNEKTYRFKLMDHRLQAPRLAVLALVEAVTAGDRSEGDMTAIAQYSIETDDGRTIEKKVMSTGSGAARSLASSLLNDVAPIYSNSFDVRSVRNLTATVTIRDKIESAVVQSAYLDRSTYKPGQTVNISIYVKPFRKPRQRIKTTLQLPPDLKDGAYNVVVADARTREGTEIVRAPGLYVPQDFEDVVRVLQIHFLPNHLYVMLTLPKRGITIDGREFASLPPSIAQTIAELNDQEPIVPTLGENVLERPIEMPYLIQGGKVIPIKVDRQGGR